MSKFIKFSLAVVTGLTLATSLSGCSVFYPNWGATGEPTTSATPTVDPTESASPSESASPTTSASPTESAKPKKKASVSIINLSNDGTSITAIAEVTNVSEDGGQCTLTVTGGSVTKSVSASSESNVSTTQCFALTISSAFFSTSSLSAVVSYESEGYKGASSANSVPSL